MATLPLFDDTLPDKQTDDSDNNRLNDYPSIIRDNNGRLILFYEKNFKSGMINGGVISFVSPSLSCHVEAGNGEINGIPVVWTVNDINLIPNTYTLIYVDSAGNVGHTVNFPISFVKNIITLAYANVGTTTIIRITPIEKEGLYIFNRKQVLSGPNYIWDDYESRLNVGEKPEVFFDPSSDKAYCTYIRDGSTYIRMFDTTNDLTYEDLNSINESGGVLSLIPTPLAEVFMRVGHSKGLHDIVLPTLYELGRNMVVGLHIDTNVPYVHLPYITSLYLDAMIPPPLLEVFTKSGSVYTLETQFSIDSEDTASLFNTLWAYTRGVKYLGLRVNHNLYVGVFVTDPVDYLQMRIPDNIDYSETIDPTNLKTTIFPEIWEMKIGHSIGNYNLDLEWTQTFKPQDDGPVSIKIGHSIGNYNLDFEWIQSFKPQNDGPVDIRIGHSVGEHTITNV